MRVTLLFLSSLLFSTLFFAQPVVTAAAFPSVGDTLRFAIDQLPSGISAGQPGMAQIWDFSSLSKDLNSETVYLAASAGQNSASFPTADLVVIGQNGGETFYDKTTTKLLNLGYAGPAQFNLPVNAKLAPSLGEQRAPLTFGSFPNVEKSNFTVSFSVAELPDSLFGGTSIPADSIRLKAAIERLDFVDAWGSLAIPGGSYSALREKRFQTTTTSLEMKLPFIGWTALPVPVPGIGTDTAISYHFFSPNEKGAVAVVNVSNDETQVQSVRFKNNPTVAAFEPVIHSKVKPTIQAYPNPAVEYTDLYCSNVETGDYTVKVFNIIGDVVWRQDNLQMSGSKTIRLDLSGFRKGTYLYSLTDSRGAILSTKRLLVIKP